MNENEGEERAINPWKYNIGSSAKLFRYSETVGYLDCVVCNTSQILLKRTKETDKKYEKKVRI